MSSDLINVLGIFYNISQKEDLIQYLRELGILEIVKPYLNSPSDDIRLMSLSILANIVNEDECDILAANSDVMDLLLGLLRKAMKKESRTSQGWGATELTLSSAFKH